jgi:hypothetical protein
MVLSALIIAVSVVLFLYWFRYSCVLILNTRTTRDYSEGVAAANQLSFAAIQDKLGESEADLISIRQSLENDFRVVGNLLAKAGGVPVGSEPLEAIMLRIDFRIMSAWFSLSHRFSESGAKTALDEMTQIVAHFANTCGERSAESARA